MSLGFNVPYDRHLLFLEGLGGLFYEKSSACDFDEVRLVFAKQSLDACPCPIQNVTKDCTTAITRAGRGVSLLQFIDFQDGIERILKRSWDYLKVPTFLLSTTKRPSLKLFLS